jgi:hypothetical protein
VLRQCYSSFTGFSLKPMTDDALDNAGCQRDFREA